MPRNPPPDPSFYPSPEEFELFITQVLRDHKQPLTRYEIRHNEKMKGPDGEEYQIDVSGSFRVMGVDFLVLCECKLMTRALERDVVLAFAEKMRQIKAHKGIIYCTGGFQSGAINYAKANGIALVKVVADQLVYHTKSAALFAPAVKPMITEVKGELITPTPKRIGPLYPHELADEIADYLGIPDH